jgi:hypothetical protein
LAAFFLFSDSAGKLKRGSQHALDLLPAQAALRWCALVFFVPPKKNVAIFAASTDANMAQPPSSRETAASSNRALLGVRKADADWTQLPPVLPLQR